MLLGNYLIGLREGLEAALVVSILVAYLVRTGNRRALLPVWSGVGVAVALSVAVMVVLNVSLSHLAFKTQELVGGVLSILAVALVTWMVFWMRTAARTIRADLEGRLDTALRLGPVALTTVAFLAVAREGLETAFFLWGNIKGANGSGVPITGALLGLATAVVLGHLLYRGGLRLNLRRFFTWTGAGLIVVAAGVFGYGFHDLQEAGVLPGLQAVAFAPGEFFARLGGAGRWLQTVLHGVLNVTPQVTWLQLAMWALYLVPVMTLFLLPARTPKERAAEQPSETASP